ncbi:hypothetical protein Ait01nite_012120 [Actinoplanes italicus]|uniref:Uncharacterized protein (TIGR02996 family) n=1 Tax=Actinoplanes italicus TaxID=113567 RepID=A0A2T0KHE0_9ACTN|nr:TIGR02996 domain-containing protein [Actinoplanes italicus]PRX22647.1 uncharacterized protein (TIGR02996 family) [Actinoplanes italicus]GIE28167.1 hypothetical protein Ait01nite_012120 [Actinoplanes italicus]
MYADILADPHDMDLRLAYADHIQATDPEHAELIRLQITNDRQRTSGAWRQRQPPHRPAPGEPGISSPTPREQQLTAALRDRLTPPLPAAGTVRLQRGFPEYPTIAPAAFLDHADDLARLIPWRGIRFGDWDETDLGDLLTSPLLARAVYLDLSSSHLDDAGLRLLASSPHLKRLRWLGLADCGITLRGVQSLAEAGEQNLPSLQYVDLTGNLGEFTPRRSDTGPRPYDDWATPIHIYDPWDRPWLTRQDRAAHLYERFEHLPWLDDAWAWHQPPMPTAV